MMWVAPTLEYPMGGWDKVFNLNVRGLFYLSQQVAIRIGCHFGPVVLEHKDIFGASVHTANRMTSQAKAGQIILSADTLRRCSPEWRATSRRPVPRPSAFPPP